MPQKLVEIRATRILLAAIFSITATLVAILEKKFMSSEPMWRKYCIFVCKKPVEIRKIKLWSATILNIAATLVPILKRKG